jgi:hypothetical protein
MNAKIILEIPEGFDVEKYTSHLVRKDKRHGVIDALHYILQYINKDGVNKGNTTKGTSINLELLRKNVGFRNADEALKILIDNGIIQKTKNYSALLKTSNQYKLTDEFPYGKTKKVFVQGKQLDKSIRNSIEEKAKKERLVDKEVSHLTKFLKDEKLTFDSKKGKKTLYEIISRVNNDLKNIKTSYNGKKKENYLRKCNTAHLHKCFSILNNISNLTKNKGISYSRSSSNLRLNTDLTSISKFLRRCFTYDKKPLTQLDLSSSQPLLLYHLLNSKPWKKSKKEDKNVLSSQYIKVLQRYIEKDTYMLCTLNKINDSKLNKELLRFKNLFKGDFYNNIIEEIKRCNPRAKKMIGFDNRDNCKKTIMYLLFEKFTDKKRTPSQYELFKNTFPLITEILNTLKSVQKNSVALILQRTESELFIDVITKQIAEINHEIPLFTIHDAIYTTDEYKDIVYQIMTEILTNEIGIVPVIKIKSEETELTEDLLKSIVEDYMIDIKSKVRKKEYTSDISNVSLEGLTKFIKEYKFNKSLEENFSFSNLPIIFYDIMELVKIDEITTTPEEDNNTPDIILDNGYLINFK